MSPIGPVTRVNLTVLGPDDTEVLMTIRNVSPATAVAAVTPVMEHLATHASDWYGMRRFTVSIEAIQHAVET